MNRKLVLIAAVIMVVAIVGVLIYLNAQPQLNWSLYKPTSNPFHPYDLTWDKFKATNNLFHPYILRS